uniref:Uncharacterized protein n=1 Tax=Nonomuraea gerenzanensis TaxID=93944 RepID=A0A1M4EJT4_9ACTN|nr:hypothetical protein BN4615_P8494 [Nonomuraea gerenzanensis]
MDTHRPSPCEERKPGGVRHRAPREGRRWAADGVVSPGQ